MPKLPKIKFDASAFGHTFVGRKATRWLEEAFSGLGEERIIFTVRNNRNLLDYVPEQLKAHYKGQAQGYREIFPKFTDEEVYQWVPGYWRGVIESVEGGKTWGLLQVAAIRNFAMT